ncbi:MAG TPA: hypothetical protein VM864_16445 [Pyrinomonadaceae bacterium]|jgi:hypothetical protein|nr:hypothetical protein [Pyrinomonadaceae bacterium]
MSKEHESADLILKLYDLRREAVMRQARDWYFTFNPETIEEVVAAARGEKSAYFRMVVSYWDMACSLVNNGAIDEQMFADANGEQNYVFAKLHPFITQMRELSKQPQYLANLEKYVMRQPDAEQRMESLRAFAKQMNAQRAAAAGQPREGAASA